MNDRLCPPPLYRQSSMLPLQRLVLPILLLVAGWAPSALGQSSPDTLHLVLDLRQPLDDEWLDPATETVGVRGDHPPLSWSTTYPATDPDDDGRYEVAIPFDISSDSLTLAYKIKVDGAGNPDDGWQAGRNHLTTLRPNRRDTVHLAWTDRPPPPPSTITGRVDVLPDVKAPGGMASRTVYVYLPPGYAETDRRYPVLYLHDGQTVFDAAAAGQEWRMDEAAEQLIRDGEIEPLIIVGVSNTGERVLEYTPTRQTWRHRLDRAGPPTGQGPWHPVTGAFATETGDTLRIAADEDTLQAMLPGSTTWQPVVPHLDNLLSVPGTDIALGFENTDGPASYVLAMKPPQGGGGDRYGAFLVSTVKPMIDRRYRTRPDAASTGLGGASLGGLITLSLGLDHPDVFSRLLVASPSVWWDDRWILEQVRQRTASTGQRIWLDVGTAEGDGMVQNTRALRDALRKAGWTTDRLRYVEHIDAAHNERAWAERAPHMLRFLFPPETD